MHIYAKERPMWIYFLVHEVHFDSSHIFGIGMTRFYIQHIFLTHLDIIIFFFKVYKFLRWPHTNVETMYLSKNNFLHCSCVENDLLIEDSTDLQQSEYCVFKLSSQKQGPDNLSMFRWSRTDPDDLSRFRWSRAGPDNLQTCRKSRPRDHWSRKYFQNGKDKDWITVGIVEKSNSIFKNDPYFACWLHK